MDEILITRQLKKIIASDHFANAYLKTAFLAYVVRETLAGRDSAIKAYNIAVEGLGMPEAFDPQTDSRIRVLANRLRQTLDEYYERDGKDDPVRIQLPKGRYVPVFNVNEAGKKTTLSRGVNLVVMPFSHPDENELGRKLAWDLGDALGENFTRFDSHYVVPHNVAQMFLEKGGSYFQLAENLDTRFVLFGRIENGPEEAWIAVTLIDCLSNRQLWSKRFTAPLTDETLGRVRETVIRETIGELGGIAGVLFKTMKETAAAAEGDISALDAMIAYAEAFQVAPSPQQAARRVEHILKKALVHTPMHATLNAMLAETYLTGFAFGLYRDPAVLDLARDHIARALLADPDNGFALMIEAFDNTSNNMTDLARASFEKVILKHPYDIFLKTLCGYGLFLAGEFERGIAVIDKALEINPYLARYCRMVYFLDHLRKGQFQEALIAAERFYVPGLFWSPLLRAAALGLLGRGEEAEKSYEELLRLRPDFVDNGHLLIQFTIISQPIQKRLFKGLEKAVGYKVPDDASNRFVS